MDCQLYFKDIINDEFSNNVNYKGKLFEYQQRLHLKLPTILTIQKYIHHSNPVCFHSTMKLTLQDNNEVVITSKKDFLKKIYSEQFICYEAIQFICSNNNILTSDVSSNGSNEVIVTPANSNTLNVDQLSSNLLNLTISSNNNDENSSKYLSDIINIDNQLVMSSFIDSVNYKSLLIDRQQRLHLPLPIIETIRVNNMFISNACIYVNTHDSITLKCQESEGKTTKKLSQQYISHKSLMTLIRMNINDNNNESKLLVKKNNKHSYNTANVMKANQLHSINFNMFNDMMSNRIDPLAILSKEVAFNLSDILSNNYSNSFKKSDLIAYYHMISSNCIAIMSTSSSKTLSASLAMARYRRCNPMKLSVYLVDKISLVKHKAVSINHCTGMILGTLSSSSTSRDLRYRLNENRLDGFISTINIFNDVISNNSLSLSMISIIIFDCCDYNLNFDIINLINLLPEQTRPRLVCLTASPTIGLEKVDAIKKLDDMVLSFGQAIIYKHLVNYNHFISWRVISRTNDQINRNLMLFDQLVCLCNHTSFHHKYSIVQLIDNCKSYLTNLSVSYNHNIGLDDLISNETETESSYYDIHYTQSYESFSIIYSRLKTMLLYLCSVIKPNNQILCDEINKCIESIDENEYLGYDLYNSKSNLNHLSVMLTTLTSEIDNLITLNLTDPKIIIFVHDITIAENLINYLIYRYRYLNCEMIMESTVSNQGMSWSKQSDIINRLASGDIQIVVSTSVLDKVLDTIGCNLILCYGPKSSLIHFVHYRYRDSQIENTKIIIFLYNDEYALIDRIERDETLLDEVIQIIQSKTRT